MTTLAAALISFRKDVEADAETRFNLYAKAIEERIAEHGGDVEAAYPLIYRGEPDFDTPQNAEHWRIWKMCTDGGIMHFLKPRMIAERQAEARAAYDAWIEKVCEKIGDVSSVTIEGNPITGIAVLSTVCEHGTASRYQIRQIVNYSKTGAPYYQWPARKVNR